MVTSKIDEAYINLIAAILEQAEKDLRKSIKKGDNQKASQIKKWFLSELGQSLSDNNGQIIIDRITNEVRKEKENVLL